MKNYRTKLLLLCVALLSLVAWGTTLAQEPPAPRPPDNVAGNWTIYTKGDDGGTSTKYVELKQEGNDLSGHFKGPDQSGGLEGTVNVHHIVFRTKTRNVFTFRGMIQGDTMKGTFGIRGHHGEWQAVRSN